MYKPQISPIDAQNSPLLVNLPPPQADTDHDARMMSSLAAALRRICMLKPASGKLEVSQEIHRQFKAGGQHNSENACWTCWWNLRATRTSVVYCLQVLVLFLSCNTPYEDRTMYQHTVVRSPQRKHFWKPSSTSRKSPGRTTCMWKRGSTPKQTSRRT